MAHNSLAPGFIKLKYTFSGITHVQTIPVNPSGSPVVGSEPNLTPKTGSAISMSQFITDYMVVFRPMFGSGTAIDVAEFWKQSAPEDDPIWIYDHPINLAGSSGTASANYLQSVITFRTALGGLFKWYGMEVSGSIAVNTRTAGPAFAGSILALSNYLKGSTSCFLARDNATLMSPIFHSTKYNDALRKRRLLF